VLFAEFHPDGTLTSITGSSKSEAVRTGCFLQTVNIYDILNYRRHSLATTPFFRRQTSKVFLAFGRFLQDVVTYGDIHCHALNKASKALPSLFDN